MAKTRTALDQFADLFNGDLPYGHNEAYRFLAAIPENPSDVIRRLRDQVLNMRHVIEQQTEFLRTGCDIQPQRARDRAKVFIGMGLRALAWEEPYKQDGMRPGMTHA